MLKVLGVMTIGGRTAITLEGSGHDIKNGSKLIDKNGNEIIVISVGMMNFANPDDIGKYTTVLVDSCSLTEGSELSIA